MLAVRCCAIILYCALCFWLAGGLLGLALGLVAPEYYRSVFRLRSINPEFSPMAAAAGLGAFQGFITGAVVGSAAVLAEAVFRALRARRHPAEKDRPRSMKMWFFLALIAVATATACGGAVGVVIGGVAGHRNLTEAKLAKIRPILQEPQFAGIEIDPWHTDHVYMAGEVDSDEARRDLETRMRRLFGEEEAKFMIESVWVATPRGVNKKKNL